MYASALTSKCVKGEARVTATDNVRVLVRRAGQQAVRVNLNLWARGDTVRRREADATGRYFG